MDPFELIKKTSDSYALPVRDNVDISRNYENISKTNSPLTTENPELLEDFTDLVGGDYQVIQGGLLFKPLKGKKWLRMGESSSSIRSLLDVGLYLKHLAKKGDMLIVDEPELNLHPANQRRIARLFAKLINLGIKIFITTHSDYIIKEWNTLIMLGALPRQERLEHFGYSEEEILKPSSIKAFNAKESLLPKNNERTRYLSFVPVEIHPVYGMDIEDFEQTINEMNKIQKSIFLEISE